MKPTPVDDRAIYELLVNYIPTILYSEGKYSQANEVARLGVKGIKTHEITKPYYYSLICPVAAVVTLKSLTAKYEAAVSSQQKSS